jgi:hypothetical protein
MSASPGHVAGTIFNLPLVNVDVLPRLLSTRFPESKRKVKYVLSN